MTNINLIRRTDSYKLSHWKQLPPGTEKISAYIEPRGLKTDKMAVTDGVLNLGAQAWVRRIVDNPIQMWQVNEMEELAREHVAGVPFNRAAWERIVNVHGGYLPLTVQAIPEGTVIPFGTCQVQAINTDDQIPITTYFETDLLRSIWYPSTVGTLSREIKLMIRFYMEQSCDNLDKLPFMLHDFGARGVSSGESAEIGGAAHLVNFMGTDTLEALPFIRENYFTTQMPGFSVPAAEHSTITSWGKENEARAYENMIDQFPDCALISVVSDSYDIEAACSDIWGDQLKEKVEQFGGTIVVRPDSGDPATVVVRCLEILGQKFGHTTNTKGFKVLPACIRLIQGDGIDFWSIDEICDAMTKAGWSMDNIVFGMGGALLQHPNRDWFSYAMKANENQVDGKPHPVYKKPSTDGGKASRAGRQAVVMRKGLWVTVPENTVSTERNELVTIYTHEGYRFPRVRYDTFEEIQARAAI